ncbi:hypothetical protein B0H19DRAFT_1074348 [Mycena capillaripes]|nr:hypothetical protein B0H19DRAFT_1074348 [Mycena capillaripes]
MNDALGSVSYDLQLVSTYDTLLNIDQEYRLVWKSRWSSVKCLYLWARYSPFVDTALAVHIVSRSNDVPYRHEFCAKTYALYERSLTPGAKIKAFSLKFGGHIWLCACFVSPVRGNPACIQSQHKAWLCGHKEGLYCDIKCGLNASAAYQIECVALCPRCELTHVPRCYVVGEVALSPADSCNLDSPTNIGVVCYLSLLIGETVVVLLTVWKGIRTFGVSRSVCRHTQLLKTFFRDGIMFYLAIFVILVLDTSLESMTDEGLKFIADSDNFRASNYDESQSTARHAIGFVLPFGLTYTCRGSQKCLRGGYSDISWKLATLGSWP